MTTHQRAELAARQRALVVALVAGAQPPPDMDASRIAAQAAALIRKRVRAVARRRPDLIIALGQDFDRQFRTYAASRSDPPACTSADADDFARYLAMRGGRPYRARRWLGRRRMMTSRPM